MKDRRTISFGQRGAALPWVFLGFLAIAGFFLITEHRAHLMGALPILLLALCPLMHFFHRGHGDHHGRSPPGPGSSNELPRKDSP